MGQTPESCLERLNSILKENDEIYRNAAKRVGLPDCAFWILYALRTGEEPMLQSDICACIYGPKQTVNSALKNLEAEGYLMLSSAPDRRFKQVSLTKKGDQLARETVDLVIQKEQSALTELTEEEQEAFIRIFRKYTVSLKKNLQNLKE